MLSSVNCQHSFQNFIGLYSLFNQFFNALSGDSFSFCLFFTLKIFINSWIFKWALAWNNLLDSEMALSITWDNLDISSHKKIKRVQYWVL